MALEFLLLTVLPDDALDPALQGVREHQGWLTYRRG
jgi:hypothetical protein